MKNLAHVSGGGEMSFPESNRKVEQQPADQDPNRSVPSGGGHVRSHACGSGSVEAGAH
jgi:hypothetical protein